MAGFRNIEQNYGIAVKDLNLSTDNQGAGITLNSVYVDGIDPGNFVEGVARFSTAGGDVTFFNGISTTLGASSVLGNLTVDAFDGGNGSVTLTIGDPNGGRVSVGSGSLILFADSDIVQYGNTAISAAGLTAYSNGGGITLGNPNNAISGAITLTSYQQNAITLSNSVDTAIAALQGNDGSSNITSADSITVNVADPSGLTHPGITISGPVQAFGSITLAAAGDLTLASGATLFSGNGIGAETILAAGGHFINQVGPGVLSFGNGGRFLIYSADPQGDVFGGLDSGNTAIWNTSYPTAIAATGNRYIFAYQPTITLIADDLAKASGADFTASLQNDYSVTGLQPGVAGAFLGDTDAIFSGSPLLASDGAPASAADNVYAITISAGSFAVGNGYALAFVNGNLTVGSGAPQQPVTPPTPPVTPPITPPITPPVTPPSPRPLHLRPRPLAIRRLFFFFFFFFFFSQFARRFRHHSADRLRGRQPQAHEFALEFPAGRRPGPEHAAAAASGTSPARRSRPVRSPPTTPQRRLARRSAQFFRPGHQRHGRQPGRWRFGIGQWRRDGHYPGRVDRCRAAGAAAGRLRGAARLWQFLGSGNEFLRH